MDSLRHLAILMISFISAFEIINVAITHPKVSFWISASIADATTVNPNDIKALLANGLSRFFIESKQSSANFSLKANCLK